MEIELPIVTITNIARRPERARSNNIYDTGCLDNVVLRPFSLAFVTLRVK